MSPTPNAVGCGRRCRGYCYRGTPIIQQELRTAGRQWVVTVSTGSGNGRKIKPLLSCPSGLAPGGVLQIGST